MATMYNAYLDLKTIIKELPSSLLNKLNEDEKKKIFHLFEAVEILKPKTLSKYSKKIHVVDNQTFFRPRNIIFCLNLRKIFGIKRSKLVKFAFYVIRCLFKEFQRNKNKNRPSRPKKIIHVKYLSKEAGTNTEDDRFVSFNKIRSLSMTGNQKISDFLAKKRNQEVKSKIIYA